MMKQFGRTMVSLMCLAVAAALLSSIPAQASGKSVFTAKGLGASVIGLVDNSNPEDPVTVFVNLNQTGNTSYFLSYTIFDANGTFTDSSFGTIPASSVNVSGGSIRTGKTMVTLNVNTCDFPEFIANGQCGTFAITWNELPASVAGSFAERANIVTIFPPSPQFPNGLKTVQNGPLIGYSAQVNGTAFGYSNTGGPAFGSLTHANTVSITITRP